MTRIIPVPQKQKKIPDIIKEWNNRTEESYKKLELDLPDNRNKFQVKHFLEHFSDKYPVERVVTKIVRLKAPDYNAKSQKNNMKEYVYYFENWYGKDWLGRNIAPVTDHIEGKYDEQETEPVFNERTMEITGYRRSGERTVYYIPFTKENIDKIIAKSTGSYKDNGILYCFKGPQIRNDKFTYEQFTTLSYEDMNDTMYKPGGPSKHLGVRPQARQQYG